MRTLFLLLLSCVSFTAPSQTWDWAKRANTATSNAGPTQIRTDGLGNTYLYGNTVSAGPFVTKYDASGNSLWSVNIPFATNSVVDFRVDKDGNSYFLGQYSDTINVFFYTFISQGLQDFYLLKLDQNGFPVWARSFGGISYEIPGSIAIDDDQNIFMGASFRIMIDFDGHMLMDSIQRFCLVKLDPSGHTIWATAGDTTFCAVQLIELDKQANPYIIGSNKSLGGPTSTFISKFDSTGNLLSYSIHWGIYNEVYSFAVSDSGNIFLLHNSGGHYDIIPDLVKYDAGMNMIWHKELSGMSVCYGFGLDRYRGVFLDENENAYVGGMVGHSTCNDSVYFEGQLIYIGQYSVPAVIALNTSGTMLWTKTATATNDDDIRTMAKDKDGNLMVAGIFNTGYAADHMMFDSHTLNSSGAWQQIFLAKLNVVGFTTGISEATSLNTIEIFPNPSSGIFTLRMNHSAAKVCVRDVMGRCVLQKECKHEINEIDLSANSKGVYFMEVLAEGKSVVKKIVLQ